MALFLESAQAPTQELDPREALAPVFRELNNYDATTHFVGQSTIFTPTADRATGEAYCLAHHVMVDGGKRRLILASLRYLDTFVRIDGAWLFSKRLRHVDWLGGASTVMTPANQMASMSALATHRGRG